MEEIKLMNLKIVLESLIKKTDLDYIEQQIDKINLSYYNKNHKLNTRLHYNELVIYDVNEELIKLYKQFI